MATPDLAQLTEAQQAALQNYTSITDQDPIASISLLQRSEWNVQIAVSRFFDGEPTLDPIAEAAAVPAPTSRQAANLQYESLLAANTAPSRRSSPENVVGRIGTTTGTIPTYQPPFLLSPLITPLNLLFRLLSTVLSPLSFLIPSFASRILRNLLTFNSRPSRRQLPPADTARRFIREFEETYTPNPPLPFVESGFNLTLDNCKKDTKFLLVVLISPSHDDTHTWVRDTLLSSQLYQFLQSHRDELVLWGGSVQDAEGYQVSTSLNCTKFPFAALICQTSDGTASRQGDMAVIMRAAGPTPAHELTAKLGSALTAHQAQLSAARAQRSEQQAERSLRQEQDSAYERSLAQDRERARKKREEQEARQVSELQALQAAEQERTRLEQIELWRKWRTHELQHDWKTPSTAVDTVRLSIRTQDGMRLVRQFKAEDPLEHLYAFVECHQLLEDSTLFETPLTPPKDYKHEYTFRLVSPMPRTVIDLESGGTIGDRVGRGGNLIVETLEADEVED